MTLNSCKTIKTVYQLLTFNTFVVKMQTFAEFTVSLLKTVKFMTILIKPNKSYTTVQISCNWVLNEDDTF
jgi:hypothetical protein